MDTTTIDTATVVDLFLLLLIGIGPKIALLPYLELTADLDADAKRRIVRTMLTTAAVVALVLVVFGELLRRLLHFSTGALAIAGGILLLIIAVTMVLGQGDAGVGHDAEGDPHRLAMFPLAIPYLLNPAGIVVLVTASAEARTPGDLAIVLVPLAAVLPGHRGAGRGEPDQLAPRPSPDARHREGVRVPARRPGGAASP